MRHVSERKIVKYVLRLNGSTPAEDTIKLTHHIPEQCFTRLGAVGRRMTQRDSNGNELTSTRNGGHQSKPHWLNDSNIKDEI